MEKHTNNNEIYKVAFREKKWGFVAVFMKSIRKGALPTETCI